MYTDDLTPPVGVTSGAATLFPTIGGSIGVSLLGTCTLFTQQVQSALPDRTGGAPAGGQITPGTLEQCPATTNTPRC